MAKVAVSQELGGLIRTDWTWRTPGFLVPGVTSSEVGGLVAHSHILSFIPTALTSTGGPPTDEAWVTIRLGSFARVVARQELGGQIRTDLTWNTLELSPG